MKMTTNLTEFLKTSFFEYFHNFFGLKNRQFGHRLDNCITSTSKMDIYWRDKSFPIWFWDGLIVLS